MLLQRRRRWASIETALGECRVFAGNYTFTPYLSGAYILTAGGDLTLKLTAHTQLISRA